MRIINAGVRLGLMAAVAVALPACRTSAELVQPTAAIGNASSNQSRHQPLVQPKPNPGRVIHAVVALCDNQYQGIVPVPARIGNGDDPESTLYWGAAFGVRTFFNRAPDWSLVAQQANPKPGVLERCVFKHRNKPVYLVADAYRGREIKRCTADFFAYAAGKQPEELRAGDSELTVGSGANLIVYVGHDGLMDFALDDYPEGSAPNERQVIILACASRQYYAAALRKTGATPLLWTTGLMAPEAYVLKAAIDGWVRDEGGPAVRTRAAAAYNAYQRCGLGAANRLFATGW